MIKYYIITAIFIAIIISLIIKIIHNNRNNNNYLPETNIEKEKNDINNIKDNENKYSIFPYERKYLLTKNEWYFYKKLKPVADKLGYTVLAKIRMADLIDIKRGYSNRERMKYFGKIKSKHVDFALAKPENLLIELLIELDDSSHNKNIDRDDFVNTVYQKTGYKLLRVYSGEQELERKITETINQQ